MKKPFHYPLNGMNPPLISMKSYKVENQLSEVNFKWHLRQKN
jgi:hypothetical protein